MYAKNRIGKSEASNELTITTDEAGTLWFCSMEIVLGIIALWHEESLLEMLLMLLQLHQKKYWIVPIKHCDFCNFIVQACN